MFALYQQVYQMATIQKRGDRYRVLIRKQGHAAVSETFSTLALAKRFAKDTEHKLELGKFCQDKATVEDTVEHYIERMAEIGKPVANNKVLVIRRAARDLAGKRLEDLTTETIVNWISGKRDVVASTRQQYMVYFRTVLTTAEALWNARPKMDEFERAARFLRMHGITAESDARDRRVTDEEIQKIIHLYPHARIPYADILRFQIASAFRIGETCALRWADLNEEDRTILIRQRKHPKKKRDEIAPLLGEAWEIICRQPREGEFIFPYRAQSVTTAVILANAKGAVKDLHLHDLRHEAISRLFEQGFGIAEVQLCSGHKDLKMLQRYLHLRPKDLHLGPVAIRRYKEQIESAGNVVPLTRVA
jgi:integrase